MGITNERKKWSLPIATDFAKDLIFFVGLYATRGTDIGEIRLRSTDEMSNVIKVKAETYGIKAKSDRRAGKGKGKGKQPSAEVGAGEEKLSKDELTLARLASCVPHLVCDYYKAKVGRTLVMWPEGKKKAWDVFPEGLRHNVLAYRHWPLAQRGPLPHSPSH